MILAYGSVKWWRIFSPDRCSDINRFVVLFAVPLLSFHFLSTINPYAMNYRFIATDTLQKIIVLTVPAIWSRTSSRGCLEWTITFFPLATLPNPLVMGILLVKGVGGPDSDNLMVQIVVLQCIIWCTLMLFLFEYRRAKLLIIEQFSNTIGSTFSKVIKVFVVLVIATNLWSGPRAPAASAPVATASRELLSHLFSHLSFSCAPSEGQPSPSFTRAGFSRCLRRPPQHLSCPRSKPRTAAASSAFAIRKEHRGSATIRALLLRSSSPCVGHDLRTPSDPLLCSKTTTSLVPLTSS